MITGRFLGPWQLFLKIRTTTKWPLSSNYSLLIQLKPIEQIGKSTVWHENMYIIDFHIFTPFCLFYPPHFFLSPLLGFPFTPFVSLGDCTLYTPPSLSYLPSCDLSVCIGFHFFIALFNMENLLWDIGVIWKTHKSQCDAKLYIHTCISIRPPHELSLWNVHNRNKRFPNCSFILINLVAIISFIAH